MDRRRPLECTADNGAAPVTTRQALSLVFLVTTPEAARRLGLQPQTLRLWRLRGIGPAYVRLSANRVGYSEDALQAFISSRTYTSTAEESTLKGRTA